MLIHHGVVPNDTDEERMIPNASTYCSWQKLVDAYEGEGVLNMWDFTVLGKHRKRKHMRKNMDSQSKL